MSDTVMKPTHRYQVLEIGETVLVYDLVDDHIADSLGPPLSAQAVDDLRAGMHRRFRVIHLADDDPPMPGEGRREPGEFTEGEGK